jgi:hypothetical protein
MGGVRVCHPLQSAKTVSYPVRPAVFPSLRVSSVALVHPVVVVSPVVDVSAVLRAAAVAPVPAMRWCSSVYEGGIQQWNQTGCADSEHPGSGMSRRTEFTCNR